MGKKTDHEDEGCVKMTKFLGERSKCQTCSLPKCGEGYVGLWWDGLYVGNDIGLLDGIREGARGTVHAINRYMEAR
ncbi:hypothetical protein LCGC14_1191780 [marine sediment metagenome]|uniref:Uncharacterized protein n=1 Tax=marine sediment metagenome TaxID=412755 RepID=A0A0F9PPG8_9ZZZZ